MMIRRIIRLGILAGMTLAAMAATQQQSGPLMVKIHDLESGKGALQLAVFDRAADFLQPGAQVLGQTIPLLSPETSLTVELPNLLFGRYALAIFHDINNNGVLDTNVFGIPVEPYAFSNNPRVKWRSPRFEEVNFVFSRRGQVVEVRLMRWKER